MGNKINFVTQKEMALINKNLLRSNSFFIADLDGIEIHNLEDYLSEINKLFKFPLPSSSIDSYLDWIRDLDWLTRDGYVLIIHNYSEFIKDDLQVKNKIIGDFERIVLPWWQEDVEKCVVEGKAKPFNLFLVD